MVIGLHQRTNNDRTGSTSITAATGSGKYDVIVYVPVSDFNLNDKYAYVFRRSGNGGFEEWTAATLAAPIPEAGALFLIVGLLVAIFSTQFLRRLRRWPCPGFRNNRMPIRFQK